MYCYEGFARVKTDDNDEFGFFLKQLFSKVLDEKILRFSTERKNRIV